MPTAKAGAQCRVPVPSPPRRHGGKRGRWEQARLEGASEAGGGRRGRWGQARLVGAGEANGGRKPPGQIPSQHFSLATNQVRLDRSLADIRHSDMLPGRIKNWRHRVGKYKLALIQRWHL